MTTRGLPWLAAVALVGLLGACQDDLCKEHAPAMEVTVKAGSVDTASIKKLHVEIIATGRPKFTHTYTIDGEMNDGQTSFVVVVGNPGKEGFSAKNTVTAKNGQNEVGKASTQVDASGDGCNWIVLTLSKPSPGDAGVDALDAAGKDLADLGADLADAPRPDTGKDLSKDSPKPDLPLADLPKPDLPKPDLPKPDLSLPDLLQLDACVGAVCKPANICKTGNYPCGSDAGVCKETGDKPNSTSCGVSKACKAGACVACGKKGNLCCGTSCDSSLSCVLGTCACGASGQDCCNGKVCNTGLTCDSTKKCSCGKLGEACCPSKTCSGGLLCLGTCSCLRHISSPTGNLTLVYTNGTVSSWKSFNSTFFPVKLAAGGPLTGAVSGVGGNMTGCVLKKDSTVWCWAHTTNLNANNYGQLGRGNTSAPSTAWEAAQVLVVGNKPLTGVASLSGQHGTFCAVKKDTTAWCWGVGNSGQLGIGSKASSPYAVQVMASKTAQFTNVAEIHPGEHHTCARKKDKTAWCWGHNHYGQLGLGLPGTPGTYLLYPGQVKSLFTNVVELNVAHRTTCARTSPQNDLWCWGINSNYHLGPSVTATWSAKPVQVMNTATGGKPLTGVEEVRLTSQLTCVRKSGSHLWCWGYGVKSSGPSAPGPYLFKGSAVYDVTRFGGYGYWLWFTNSKNQLWVNNSLIAQKCP